MESHRTYLASAVRRIVRQFERYLQNINPDDERFLTFVSEFLARNNVKNPEEVPYSELHVLIRKAIREFLANLN